MKRNVIFSLIFSLFVIACNDDAPLYKAEAKPDGTAALPTGADKIAQALSRINRFFNGRAKPFNSSGSSSRVLTGADVIDTIDIKDPQKRVVLQLLCFKPGGYALISALKEVPNPSLLFYSKGKFDAKNINPGLASYICEFIDNSRKTPMDANARIEREAATMYMLPDPGGGSGGGGGSSPYHYEETVVSRYSQAKQKGPLLTTYWNQYDPFNRQCPIIDGRRALAGCTAIAIGQIINYHRRDAHKYYDWSKIQDTTNYPNTVAAFIHDIGMAVHMKYGSHGSRTSPEKAAHYFSGAGYYAHLRSYNYEICKADIDRGNPVYLSAKDKRKGVYFIIRWAWKYESGHAWVVDGYKSITDYRKVEVEDGSDTYYRDIAEKTTNYIHMNWGWGPGTDSWCTYDYFKVGETVYKYKKKMIAF